MFIDVHCHASMFEDVEKEIENAKMQMSNS